MNMIPIKNSSQIAAVGHEARTGLLTVEFKSGGKYMYGNVPESMFSEMLNAESVGSWFHKNIKNSKNHNYIKMEEPPQG